MKSRVTFHYLKHANQEYQALGDINTCHYTTRIINKL